MKVIKRGLFMLVILLFGLGSVVSLALAQCKDNDEMPKNGSYGFAMAGSNVIAAIDVPTTAMSGVFTTATVNTTPPTFSVTAGSFILNDDGNICTGSFSGTGACNAPQVTAGLMTLTTSNLVDVTPGGCNTIDSTPGATLTLQYGLFNSQSAMFLMDADTDTYSVVGEGQQQ